MTLSKSLTGHTRSLTVAVPSCRLDSKIFKFTSHFLDWLGYIRSTRIYIIWVEEQLRVVTCTICFYACGLWLATQILSFYFDVCTSIPTSWLYYASEDFRSSLTSGMDFLNVILVTCAICFYACGLWLATLIRSFYFDVCTPIPVSWSYEASKDFHSPITGGMDFLNVMY